MLNPFTSSHPHYPPSPKPPSHFPDLLLEHPSRFPSFFSYPFSILSPHCSQSDHSKNHLEFSLYQGQTPKSLMLPCALVSHLSLLIPYHSPELSSCQPHLLLSSHIGFPFLTHQVRSPLRVLCTSGLYPHFFTLLTLTQSSHLSLSLPSPESPSLTSPK